MPSFQDSAFIILLGLLLFGPKGLANIARQIGKLMGEFRRASADFRMQMEDELRVSEQAEQQKKIAAMEAAAPPTPLIPSTIPEPEHPHMPPPVIEPIAESTLAPEPPAIPDRLGTPTLTQVPLPIASSGSIDLMPPATGLPVARGKSVTAVFDAIPHTPDPAASPEPAEQKAAHNA